MALKMNASQRSAAVIVIALLAVFTTWRVRVFMHESAPEQAAEAQSTSSETQRSNEREQVELNAADSLSLLDVSGIGPAFAHRIIRYRQLIGGYTHREQLMRVYGITPENYLRMEPQIYVDTNTVAFKTLRTNKARNNYANAPYRQPAYANPRHHGQRFNSQRQPETGASLSQAPRPDSLALQASATAIPASRPASTITLVNVNTADSASLLRVPGIGPGTAGRIVRFRDRMLFFRSVEQVAEVWGIRPENFEKMKPYLKVGDLSAYPRVYINEWDESHLGRHPYIGYKDAKILVAYREQHGPFKNAESLRWVLGINPELPGKLEGYLQF